MLLRRQPKQVMILPKHRGKHGCIALKIKRKCTFLICPWCMIFFISYSNHLNQYTDWLIAGEQYILNSYIAHFSSGFTLLTFISLLVNLFILAFLKRFLLWLICKYGLSTRNNFPENTKYKTQKIETPESLDKHSLSALLN